MVGGISRSGTSFRNLNQAMVGAKEPIPSVSKKLVIAPRTTASGLGGACCAIAAFKRMKMKASVARMSGTSRATSIASPFERRDTSVSLLPHRARLDQQHADNRARDRLNARGMLALDEQQQTARDWFESLRDRICREFESIEREAGSDATFEFTPWDRTDPNGEPGGGGVRGQMNGQVFEKVGVNVSTVGGSFSPEFAASIHGAQEDPSFFATGISLVAHMANPHVPAVHMNTRFLCTTKRWFGGGADLNPPIPYDEDTAQFHARFRAACAAHDPTFYPRFSKWAEEYFWLPHRHRARGVGGIFYDRLECAAP